MYFTLTLALSRREIIIHFIRSIFTLFSSAYLMNAPLYIARNTLMITYFVLFIISSFLPTWIIYDSHSFYLTFRKSILLHLFLISMWNILLNCLLSVSASGEFRLSFILIFLGSFLMGWPGLPISQVSLTYYICFFICHRTSFSRAYYSDVCCIVV